MSQRPHAFFCLWEYVPLDKKNTARLRHKYWKLVECYGVDDNGYAVTKSKYASDDRHSYDDWISRKVWFDQETDKVYDKCPPHMDEDDNDRDSMPGRMVTIWSFDTGVRLAAFVPPENLGWLSMEFGEKLRNLKNWHEYIQGGHYFVSETAEAVEKMLFSEEANA